MQISKTSLFSSHSVWVKKNPLPLVNESMSQQLSGDDFVKHCGCCHQIVLMAKVMGRMCKQVAGMIEFVYSSWWYCDMPTPHVDWVKNRRLFGGWNFPTAASLLTWGKKGAAVAVIIILLSAPLFDVVHIVEPTVMDSNTLLKKCKKHLWLEPKRIKLRLPIE